MATDKEYLDELMNSIAPLVYPDGIPGEENEEEYDDSSDVVVPENEPEALQTEPEVPIEEAQVEVPTEEAQIEVPMEEAQVEVPMEEAQIEVPMEEAQVEIPVEESEPEAQELEEEMMSMEDIDALLSEKGAPKEEMAPLEEEIELDADMSAEDIEALLNAAKEVDSAQEVNSDADVKDILSMFSDDEELSDIKDTLEKDDNNQAVDERALETPEIELPNIDEEEEPKKKKKEKKEKKEKKSKKTGDAQENQAEEGKNKKGFFAKLLGTLTEEVEEESEKPVSVEESQTVVTDENAQILNELDAEEGKKKKKKDKKSKKGKKDKDAKEGSDEEEIRDKDEEGGEPEGKGKKKKEKKEKKPKKEKTPKEPEKPGKKLPKKRVRNTVILCLSIFVAIVLLSVLVNEFMNLSKARFAFESADYETAYEDLYGLELKEEDQEIYDKSMTIMLLCRKSASYENYKRLGMEKEALNALIQGVKLYGEIRNEANALGVSAQVEEEYAKILNYLAQYNLTEIRAAEIAVIESKVEYNKTLQSLVPNSGAEIVEEEIEQEIEETQEDGMQDVLQEEQEDLFGTPNQVIEIGYDEEDGDIAAGEE